MPDLEEEIKAAKIKIEKLEDEISEAKKEGRSEACIMSIRQELTSIRQELTATKNQAVELMKKDNIILGYKTLPTSIHLTSYFEYLHKLILFITR